MTITEALPAKISRGASRSASLPCSSAFSWVLRRNFQERHERNSGVQGLSGKVKATIGFRPCRASVQTERERERERDSKDCLGYAGPHRKGFHPVFTLLGT